MPCVWQLNEDPNGQTALPGLLSGCSSGNHVNLAFQHEAVRLNSRAGLLEIPSVAGVRSPLQGVSSHSGNSSRSPFMPLDAISVPLCTR